MTHTAFDAPDTFSIKQVVDGSICETRTYPEDDEEVDKTSQLAARWQHTPWIEMDMAAAMDELKKLALELPEEQRAHLAASLLDSLPGILVDQDEGVAEALRRDAELDAHPELALSIEQLDNAIRDRHR